MVRKKWLSLYYSAYWCSIHQTCTNCSSWHGLLMQHGDFCPWPTFHAGVTMVRKKRLSLYYSTYECYIHQTYTNCLSGHDLLMPRGGLCPWPIFHASVTKTQNGNSGTPVMVPITIMSSYSYFYENVIFLYILQYIQQLLIFFCRRIPLRQLSTNVFPNRQIISRWFQKFNYSP